MIRDEIKNKIETAFYKFSPGNSLPDFRVEISESPEHGDYATNVALLLGKAMKRNPMEIAEEMAAELGTNNWELGKINIAPPGFINFRLADDYIIEELNKKFDETGENLKWKGKKVAIEFTDPNPFKEFHIGHLYTNIVGEALSRVLEANGAVVKRINYQGDVGMHVAKAIWGITKKMQESGLALKELEEKPLEERLQFMGEGYAYGSRSFEAEASAKEEMAVLNKKIFELDEGVKEIYLKGREWSLEYFERIYKRLGTKFDLYYFEREVGGFGRQLVEEELKKGIFEKSDGAVVFPGEKYGLHRRVFINSEGFPTYEAKELGLAPAKYRDFPYDLSLIVTGSEIIDYFKVLLAALNLIYPELRAKTLHIPHGMVRTRVGKMSSRTGEVLRAEDLLREVKEKVRERMKASVFSADEKEEIAEKVMIGAIKYSLLRVGIGKDIVFDIDTSLNMEGDSGPYLQYTYARFKSILRKIETNQKSLPVSFAMSDTERRVAATLLRFPEVLQDSADSFSPNILTTYLHGLAMLANDFYHTHPVLQEPDSEKRNFRVALVQLLANTLKKGLGVLGIDAPEKM